MIKRSLSSILSESASQYPVVSITGPRQSGKTTLVKAVFPERNYISLEELDTREFAQKDPRGFIDAYPENAILDEIQRAPDLFSYIQTHVDELGTPGVYVLTGSSNFGLMEGLSQSLAGRVSILELLPFSYDELVQSGKAPDSIEKNMLIGAYPRIHDLGLEPTRWYANYVSTYLERDVRQIKNVTDLSAFQNFLRMCAARSGQILNLSALGNDCGITHNTAKSWLSILQTGYIVYLLRPHHSNFNKRLIKSPKLYFYDSGLLSYLLGISSPEMLKTHAYRGHIFETWVISELLKGRANRGLDENIYFWRDNTGHEVDCIIDQGDKLIPLEIKSGKTVSEDFFSGLRYYAGLAKDSATQPIIVYAGLLDQPRKEGNVLSWRSFGSRNPVR